jgi:hypothetical protein
MLTTWKWPPTTGTTTKQQYKNNTTSEERLIYTWRAEHLNKIPSWNIAPVSDGQKIKIC